MVARSGTMPRRRAFFAEVAKTTEIAKRGGVLERTEEGKSEATLKLYHRLARSRVDTGAEGGGRLMEGVTAASWHTVRAAVLHELADEYRRWRKAGDKEPDFARALTRQRGRDAVLAFEKVAKMERHLANRCPLA